jgi:hypothetical protein
MNKITVFLFLAFVFSLSAYAQNVTKPASREPKKTIGSKKKRSRSSSNLGPTNMFRISAFGLVNKLKLHYEKVISTKSALGITAAIYYSDQDRGSIKIEPHYKYFLSSKAPSGTYLIGGPTIFMFNNYNFRYTAGSEQQAVMLANQPFYNAITKDQIITNIQAQSFTTIGGCVGFGYQFLFGKSNNFVLDFAAGYQYAPIPASVKEPITQEKFVQTSTVRYDYKVNYQYSDKINFFGITSPIFTKLSVGILF